MKKNNFKYIWFVLGFFIGLSILLYPVISSRWNAYRAKQLISTYGGTVTEDSDPEAYQEAMDYAERYNDELVQESVPDAFSVRDGVTDAEYESKLNLDGDGLMGSIEIPQIGETLPIYHYTTDESLQKGVGHLLGSSLPVGGESTHAVLSAHRGLPSAKLFTDLPLLVEGDQFYIHILGNTLAYEVDGTETVEPTEVKSLAIVNGEDRVTLVTCTPYGVNTQRFLVHAHRVEYVPEVYEEVQQQGSRTDSHQLFMQVFCVLIGLFLAFVVVVIIMQIDKRKAAAGKRRSSHTGRDKHGKKK
ncbi:MAG: class C sortase [Lachnospiraceae bacterium]|nr:class C sortase [Lachnospiraceae bacterium]